MNESNKMPGWFLILSIILLIWNLIGVMAFIGQVGLSPEDIAAMPEREQAMYLDVPIWNTIAFALAVFGGSLGCLGLVLKKKWSRNILILSFAGIVVQMIYNFFISEAMEVYGPGGMIMPILVLLIGFGLIFYANLGIKRGWLS